MNPSPSTTPRLVPGVLVADKYRLLRPLGAGAMGVVWAAMNETTVREVAVKLIARPDPELRRRLLREARACGALRHPNIVDIYDVAQADTGDPLLVMELLTGQSLAELLADKRRLPPPLAARIARDVAGALAAAHGHRIIHRDLKPANIFLHRPSAAGSSTLAPRAGAPSSEDFVVKVVDFGVAKHLGATDGPRTAVGGAVGLPLYMSPEQARGDAHVDPRSDLWSLGVVLFEMLSGVRPFQGEGPGLLTHVLDGEIPKLSRYLRHADERLVAIVDRCLRRNREERFRTAAELAERLDVIAAESEAGSGEIAAGAMASARTPKGTLKMSKQEADEARKRLPFAPQPAGPSSTTPLTRAPKDTKEDPTAAPPVETLWTRKGFAALVAIVVACLFLGVLVAMKLVDRDRRMPAAATSSPDPATPPIAATETAASAMSQPAPAETVAPAPATATPDSPSPPPNVPASDAPASEDTSPAAVAPPSAPSSAPPPAKTSKPSTAPPAGAETKSPPAPPPTPTATAPKPGAPKSGGTTTPKSNDPKPSSSAEPKSSSPSPSPTSQPKSTPARPF